LGWRSPGSLLVGVEHKDYEILESPTDGGAPRTLSRLTRGSGQLFRAREAQFASGLVAEAVVRDPGSPQRGPWPWWWRLTLGAVILLVGWWVWRALRRRGVGLADLVGLVDLRVRPRRPRGDGGAGRPPG
ncbi:MAG TPA: hypothetical protein VFR67_07300, partial [Pilimelia sp.]|nr:hypothetical protein [Pilimelia sp.]